MNIDFEIENRVLNRYAGEGETVIIPDGVNLINYYAFSRRPIIEVIIPEGVTEIRDNAFTDCRKLQKVVLPTTLKTIGKEAFAGCTLLEEVILPEQLIKLEDNAFRGCTSLKKVVINSSLPVVKGFKDCASLISVELPEGLVEIGSDAFSSCKSITSLTLPSTVKSISQGAFSDCENLKEIIIPNGLTSIDRFAFSNCAKLSKICIPAGADISMRNPFRGCNSLADERGFVIVNGILCHYCGQNEAIAVPTSVNKIADDTFGWNTSIVSITIPESVSEIGRDVFIACSRLKDVSLPNSIEKIEGLFDQCSSLVNVSIPESVSSISGIPFSRCKQLKKVYLPAKVVLSGFKATQLTFDQSIFFFFTEKGVPVRGLAYCEKKDDDNFKAFYGSKGQFLDTESSWGKYDEGILNNGPKFKCKEDLRLRAAIWRLMRPNFLSAKAKNEYIKLLAKNVKKMVSIAEEDEMPEYIETMLTEGIVNDSNRKTVLLLIARSSNASIAELSPESAATEIEKNANKRGDNKFDPTRWVEISKDQFSTAGSTDPRGKQYEYAQSRFRGYESEIEKLRSYLDAIPEHYEYLEVENGVFEIRLSRDASIAGIIEKFPALKATGLREDFRHSVVEVWISLSGYSVINECDEAGCFDGEYEDGDARWAYEYDMMEKIRCKFDHSRMEQVVSVNYSYPAYLKKLWNDLNYVVDFNGKYYKKS